ncbi:MAG TPA: hypothetical protein PLN18_01435 [Candidatus Colwellbacteria bacterium]|nr:hypothetical protein [Candidatus Colwellbacteria bacterium]
MTVLNWLEPFGWAIARFWYEYLSQPFMTLLGAAVLFVIGLFIARLIERLVAQAVRALRIDSLLKKAGIEPYLDRANVKLDSGKFFGKLVYWFIVGALLLVIADKFGLPVVSQFISTILSQATSFVGAIVILVLAVIVANFVRSVIRAAAMGAKMQSAKLISVLSWWIIIYFGLENALSKLGIDISLLKNLIYILGVGLSFAIAIAFGMAGKDYANSLIEKWRDQVDRD